MKVRNAIGIAIGATFVMLLCTGGCAALVSGNDPEPKPSYTGAALDPSGSGQATKGASTSSSPAPTGRNRQVPTYGDGQYQVGKDLPAGRYKTTGPEEGGFEYCYWERTKDTTGNFEAIIANENVKGQGYVTLKPGEYFKTSGCKPWVKG